MFPVVVALIVLAVAVAAIYLILKNMGEEGVEVAAPGSCKRGQCGVRCASGGASRAGQDGDVAREEEPPAAEAPGRRPDSV